MLVCDTATALSQERTPEGFLRVRARIGRTGIQLYRAGEIGAPPGVPPDRMLRVYRPPEDVFEPASLASFASKPVTLEHPPRMVDSANWKHFAVGHSGLGVERDGDHVSADLTITDAAAVARAEAGSELSNGYWADFVFEPGQTPDGEAYDALQRRIRGNHIALVDTGRCGPSCRIDADPAARTDSAARDGCTCAVTDALEVLSVDGTMLRADAAGVAVITRLRQALETRDGEIAALKGAAAALEAAAPGPAALDALVAERADLIGAARAVCGTGLDGRGQTNAAIRRLAVSTLLGPDRVRERSDDYVAAAFDTLIAAHRTDNSLGAHVAAGLGDRAGGRDAALRARDQYLTQAWKGQPAGDA